MEEMIFTMLFMVLVFAGAIIIITNMAKPK